jgi:endoglucanase
VNRKTLVPALASAAVVGALAATLPAATSARSHAGGRSLAAGTRFLVPPPNSGAVRQGFDLLRRGQIPDALRIGAMAATPQAVWVTSGTPAQARTQVRRAVALADLQHAVAVLVAYNLPGRDCGGYSAGGAQTSAEYAAWIDGFAAGIGDHAAVVVLEPDGVALAPDKCGNIPDAEKPARQAQRNAELNAAVDRLEQQPGASVYLDGGHSHWLGVGEIAQRLVAAGVQQAQGFFVNVSNYQPTPQQVQFSTWIAKCIYYANNPAEGGWRLGHFEWCASQYFPANADDYSTWGLTDQWYADNVDNAANPPSGPSALTHFVVDTSRNGQGPWHPSVSYPDPQDWCNPPGRGLGVPPTVATGSPLADAFVWVKVPGESDGSCNRGIAGATTDPEWGNIVDPPAGQWFPQQALELARLASPPVL